MHMFKVIYRLVELGIEFFYMDMDSRVTNAPLPADLISNELGLFKLEQDVAKGYFISPKLYALQTTDGNFIVKAKGIRSKLEFTQFEALITNQVIQAQERWFKDPANTNINLKNINMLISSINFKRK